MAMSRYEIRNEYSLANPEVYRGADKDDPEALLEGVAMAGLVGVLRQLGDLAEFAAELFHDLHEEVMATAARGHGLMIRVQQLEIEVPTIEKAFLTKSDHSSHFYNAGVDWHPNLQMDKNLVTRGDLPRFVMDSYEECRGPPRLFLLDKFDVAGAGSCLKRYTDPSFFKVETSGMTSTDGQRERKVRKAKKKGPRWKNGEICEVLPSSHAKLHQLFLEEPVENGVGKPARHAKLKRRLNGFPFDSRTGKSYMEKIVKSPSPDRKMLDEVPVVSSMMLLTNGHDESGLEVLDVRSVSPDRQILERKRNPSPPQREIGVLNPSTYKPEEVSLDDNICDASNSYLSIKTDDIPSTLDSIKTDDIPSTLDNMSCERDMAVDIENKTEGSLTGYQSDDIASEIDNYVDAPSTIESEMDTDSEFRAKSDFTSSSIKSHPLISEANEDHFHSQSIDSQSTGESTKSYEGNTSSRKEISSFLSADSSSTSVENPQTESFSAKRISSDGSLEISVIARSSHHKAAREDFPVDNHPKFKVSDGSSTGKDAINDHESDFEQLALNLFSNDKLPTSAHSDSENARHDIFRGSNSEVMDHTSNDKEAKTKPFVDLQCSPSVSDFKLMLEDDSSLSSSGEHLMDKPNGGSASSVTTISRNVFHNADTSVALSAELLPEDDSGLEDLNLVENITSTPRMSDIHSQEYENPEIISTEIPVPCKLDDEVLELPENTNTDHDGAHTMSPVSKEENPINEVDHEFSNVHSDASHQFSCFNEDCLVKELVETPLTDAQTVDFEDHHSDSSTGDCIISENLFVSHTQRSRDWSGPGDDAYVTDDVIPEEDITVNETPELGTSESCEVVSLLVKGDDVNSDDFEVLESSCSTSVYPEDPIGTSDSVAKDGITVCTIAPEPEITEISCSDYVESLNKEHVLVEESNFRTDQPGIADTASFTPKVSDSADRDTVNVPASHGISVEEHIPCLEDSATNELPNDQNSVSGSSTTSGVLEDDKDFLSGSYREPVLLEEVGEREAAASDMDTIFCSTPKNDHPKSEISQVVPISYLDSGVEQGLDFVKCSQVESNLEQSGKDVDQKSFWQNGVGDELSDAHFLHIDHSTEETISQEKVDAPPSGPDQRLVGPEERSSELSAPMPIDHQQMPDHDDDDDDHQKGEDGSASTFSAVSFPPPVPEFPEPRNYDIDVSGYHRDPLSSIFPPRNNFSEANGINREELPPLPPLPPVQWRMGKLLQASSCTTERDTVKHKELPSQETFPSITLTDDVTSSPEEVNHSLIRVAAPGTPSKEEEVEHRLHNSSGLEANSASRTIHLPPRESLEQGISPPTITSSNDVTSSPEEMNQSPIQVAAAEAASKEDKVEYVSSSLKANAVHQSVDLPPKTEKEQGLLDMVSSENELKLPAEEDGAANGSRPVKLPRPHNPLIDDVAALDKSKLRKVTERVRPQTEKVDERDSLLEQIRAKSFNLKPAVPSRPNTLGPKTNLKVAAILEKANAIRQAFAGSDDDDDSWSDL